MQPVEVLDVPLTLPIFMNHVGVKMLSRWQLFGILLKIPVPELDTYPIHNCAICFTRVFDSWQRKGSPEFSWETVINVLESPLLGERHLASEVRKMISGNASTEGADCPVLTSSKRVHRTGSTSSHDSHASHASHLSRSIASHASLGSHISHPSNGSVTTQTLC